MSTTTTEDQTPFLFKPQTLYRVEEQITGIILDPNNPDEPHPLFKENPEQAVLSQGVEFYVTEQLELIENDEWPRISEKQDDVEMEIRTGQVLRAMFPKTETLGIVYLQTGMFARGEIKEVITPTK